MVIRQSDIDHFDKRARDVLTRNDDVDRSSVAMRGHRRTLKLKLHSLDMLWIYCTTANPQQIEQVEFEVYRPYNKFYSKPTTKATTNPQRSTVQQLNCCTTNPQPIHNKWSEWSLSFIEPEAQNQIEQLACLHPYGRSERCSRNYVYQYLICSNCFEYQCRCQFVIKG
jgi:hypothetical protein